MILCSCCTVSLCFAVVCRGYERTVADGPFLSVRATSTLLVPDVVDQSFLNTVTVRPNSTPTATPWARVTSRSPEWGGWLGRLSISKRSRKCIQTRWIQTGAHGDQRSRGPQSRRGRRGGNIHGSPCLPNRFIQA